MASGFVAILTGFYVALVALYVLGSLGIGLVLHLSSLGSGHDPWGHRLFHACLVAAIVLLVVLALGAAALLSSR